MGVTTSAAAVRRRFDISGWIRPLGWAALVANCVLVVTGGAVRLTSSGLGCPTWPRCTQRGLTPHGALNVHSAIEFSNRLLTYPLIAIAILTFIAAWQSGRRDLRVVALLAALGIPAQAVIGGISVLTDLNPWIVSFHLLCSMAIIGLTVLFLWRLHAPAAPVARGPVVTLAWATFVAAWLVLYAGTVVTGAGPHAGDAHSARNGLDPLEISQLHADLVCLFIGLTVGLLIAAYALKASAGTRQAAWVLLGVECSQAAIGWVQYFTDLPIVLVLFHMLGAALISATVTWVLLRIRHPA